jgi:hypothetical protein
LACMSHTEEHLAERRYASKMMIRNARTEQIRGEPLPRMSVL